VCYTTSERDGKEEADAAASKRIVESTAYNKESNPNVCQGQVARDGNLAWDEKVVRCPVGPPWVSTVIELAPEDLLG
jgi:hypothetical protein